MGARTSPATSAINFVGALSSFDPTVLSTMLMVRQSRITPNSARSDQLDHGMTRSRCLIPAVIAPRIRAISNRAKIREITFRSCTHVVELAKQASEAVTGSGTAGAALTNPKTTDARPPTQ